MKRISSVATAIVSFSARSAYCPPDSADANVATGSVSVSVSTTTTCVNARDSPGFSRKGADVKAAASSVTTALTISTEPTFSSR